MPTMGLLRRMAPVEPIEGGVAVVEDAAVGGHEPVARCHQALPPCRRPGGSGGGPRGRASPGPERSRAGSRPRSASRSSTHRPDRRPSSCRRCSSWSCRWTRRRRTGRRRRWPRTRSPSPRPRREPEPPRPKRALVRDTRESARFHRDCRIRLPPNPQTTGREGDERFAHC